MTGQRSGTAATPARGGTAARPTQAWRVALTWPRPWAWRPRPDGYLPYLLEDPARAAACLAEDWTVRASINGAGGPLSYDAAHHWWEGYCAAAGVEIDIHQLRHAHATELISSGVSIEAVRRRLGHASTQTTQLYTLLDDKVADDEVRAARRRRDRQRSRRRPGRENGRPGRPTPFGTAAPGPREGGPGTRPGRLQRAMIAVQQV